jgi:hypothetical protein
MRYKITPPPSLPRKETHMPDSKITSSPVEELMDAAEQIRKVSSDASNGPWAPEYPGSYIVHGGGWTVAEAVYQAADATHIALWDPVVAEAAAAMLAVFADAFEDIPAVHEEQTRAEQAVLSLARAINAKAVSDD